MKDFHQNSSLKRFQNYTPSELDRRSKLEYVCFLILVFILLVILQACATIPPTPVHAGAGVTRHQFLDPTPQEQNPKTWALGASFDRGVSYSDTGTLGGNGSTSFTAEIKPNKNVAIGVAPFYASTDGSLDANNHFGFEAFARVKLFKAGNTAFSLYPSVRIADNSATGNGKECFIFCAGNNDTSSSRVELSEPGVGLIMEQFFSPFESLALAPSIYSTAIKTKATLKSQTLYEHDLRRTNYSLILYYHFTKKEGASLQIGVGAASIKGFAESGSRMRILPVGDLSIQFPLGREVKD